MRTGQIFWDGVFFRVFEFWVKGYCSRSFGLFDLRSIRTVVSHQIFLFKRMIFGEEKMGT